MVYLNNEVERVKKTRTLFVSSTGDQAGRLVKRPQFLGKPAAENGVMRGVSNIRPDERQWQFLVRYIGRALRY